MHGQRILVVEDDADIREATIELLVDHGFDAVGAANGREALEQLRASTNLPCLIFLDLLMPVLDGRGFREEQRRRPELAHIPVVVVSARADSARHAAELDAAAFIDKPVTAGELVRVARRLCAGG